MSTNYNWLLELTSDITSDPNETCKFYHNGEIAEVNCQTGELIQRESRQSNVFNVEKLRREIIEQREADDSEEDNDDDFDAYTDDPDEDQDEDQDDEDDEEEDNDDEDEDNDEDQDEEFYSPNTYDKFAPKKNAEFIQKFKAKYLQVATGSGPKDTQSVSGKKLVFSRVNERSFDNDYTDYVQGATGTPWSVIGSKARTGNTIPEQTESVVQKLTNAFQGPMSDPNNLAMFTDSYLSKLVKPYACANPVFLSMLYELLVRLFDEAFIWNQDRTKIGFEYIKINWPRIADSDETEFLSSPVLSKYDANIAQTIREAISARDWSRLVNTILFDQPVVMFNKRGRNLDSRSVSNRDHMWNTKEGVCVFDLSGTTWKVDYRGAWYCPDSFTVKDLMIGYLHVRYSPWDRWYELFSCSTCVISDSGVMYIEFDFDHGS